MILLGKSPPQNKCLQHPSPRYRLPHYLSLCKYLASYNPPWAAPRLVRNSLFLPQTDSSSDPTWEVNSLLLLLVRSLRTNKVTMHLKRFECAPRRMRRHKSLEVINRGDQLLQVKVAQPRPIFSIGEMFENVGHRIQSRAVIRSTGKILIQVKFFQIGKIL